ncbi:MAG: carbohydrate ABC transporter permease [Acidimicrobiia bacterium]|nr:carbohydrate ABC transporter permease [Acidimicrobiia bacterium]
MTTTAQQTRAEKRAAKKAKSGSVTSVWTKVGIYLVLSLVAAMMLFPFIFMLGTSAKTASDSFRFPPRVLPRDPVLSEFQGEVVPLFVVPIAGQDRSAALVEEGIRAGLFAPSDNLQETYAWPLDLVEATGATVDVVIEGETEPLEIFRVPVNAEVVELAKIRNTSVGRFVDVDNPSAEGFGVVRTSQPVEEISFHWSNYSEVLGIRSFDRAITNTILVTILVVGGQIFTSIMGGYAFARLKWTGRDKLFVMYLGSIMIPFVVLIIPLFQIMVKLDWNNTLGVLVWPFFYTAYGTFLMRQFFLSIPKDLEEAAVVDGAKRWRILWTIFVPLSWPAIATLATFSFLYAWNSFIWPLVAVDIGNEDSSVLTIALSTLGGQGADQPQLIFAGVTLAMVVPMLVFIAAQKYFVENVASSGLK